MTRIFINYKLLNKAANVCFGENILASKIKNFTRIVERSNTKHRFNDILKLANPT